MATLTSLPQDVLILVYMQLLVEDVLALMQTCRVMHALGSLDYLWRMLLSDWDVPLDIPSNLPSTSLPSNFLRAAAVKSLKLDTRWRDPRVEMRHAHCIVSQNSSFVDGMRFLPGGRWLVTLQYEQIAKTHVTLWSTEDPSNYHPIFRVTVVGRVRILHAHHDRELQQITIGIVFTRGAESIHVYNVFLQDESSTRYSLVFQATPDELHTMGQISGMNITGEILIAAFPPLASSPENEGRIMCVNFTSRVAAVFECPDRSFAWGRLRTFRQYVAVTALRNYPQHTTADISFYELPSVVLDRMDYISPSVPRWPETLAVKSSLKARTCWRSASLLAFEMSNDVSANNADACAFTLFGHSIRSQHMDARTTGITLLRVSFDGNSIECDAIGIACRPVPYPGDVRASPSGRRAVWLSSNPDTHECTLMKFALERETGDRCISTLMPSFSGLPFNPRDFHAFVFDETSCKLAVGLPSGELYILLM